jgi:hypothetical protein
MKNSIRIDVFLLLATIFVFTMFFAPSLVKANLVDRRSRCEAIFSSTPADPFNFTKVISLLSDPLQSHTDVYLKEVIRRTMVSEYEVIEILLAAQAFGKRMTGSKVDAFRIHLAILRTRGIDDPLVTASHEVLNQVWLPHLKSHVQIVLGLSDGEKMASSEVGRIKRFVEKIILNQPTPSFVIPASLLFQRFRSLGYRSIEEFYATVSTVYHNETTY